MTTPKRENGSEAQFAWAKRIANDASEPLSAGETADLCEQVVEAVEGWLRRHEQIVPITMLDRTDYEQDELRRADERRREKRQQEFIQHGGRLAAALVSHGFDAAPLLHLLNFAQPGAAIRSSNKSKPRWPEVKVTLQRAAILLRQPKAAEPVRTSRKSWTRQSVDEKIRDIAKKNRAEISQLDSQILNDERSAKKLARQQFGRNALAKKLRCPPAHVSASPAWRLIADRLQLRRESGTKPHKRVSEDIADELAAEQDYKDRRS